jgi:hypothetical protein
MQESLVVKFRDNGIELIESEALVVCRLLVDMSAVDHFKEVVVIDGVVKLFSNHLELLEVNCTILILVEEGEDSSDSVLGLGLSDFRGNDVKELVESYRLVLLFEPIDEIQDKWVSTIQSELFENFVDFHWVNSAAPILIKDFEGLLQLIVIDSIKSILPLRRNWF